MEQNTIGQQFKYDSNSGLLYRNGKVTTGYRHSKGYRVISVNDKMVYVHRLVYFLHTGKWPDHTIDHIDGNKENNHHSNLRDVSNRENHNNKLVHQEGKLVGYFLDKGRIRSSIRVNGKSVGLGSFNSIEEAHRAYIKKKKQIEGEQRV